MRTFGSFLTCTTKVVQLKFQERVLRTASLVTIDSKRTAWCSAPQDCSRAKKSVPQRGSVWLASPRVDICVGSRYWTESHTLLMKRVVAKSSSTQLNFNRHLRIHQRHATIRIDHLTVIQPASSEQKRFTTFPTSSGVPKRPMGVQPRICQFRIKSSASTGSVFKTLSSVHQD